MCQKHGSAPLQTVVFCYFLCCTGAKVENAVDAPEGNVLMAVTHAAMPWVIYTGG